VNDSPRLGAASAGSLRYSCFLCGFSCLNSSFTPMVPERAPARPGRAARACGAACARFRGLEPAVVAGELPATDALMTPSYLPGVPGTSR